MTLNMLNTLFYMTIMSFYMTLFIFMCEKEINQIRISKYYATTIFYAVFYQYFKLSFSYL